MKKTILCVLLLMPSFVYARNDPSVLMQTLSSNRNLAQSSQAILVLSRDFSSISANAYLCEKIDGIWQISSPGFASSIGKNGFAPIDQKREGDGKTPSGIFPLGITFGYAEKAETTMPYRQTNENDFWVDDVNSPQYNTWVKGKPDAKSYEIMKRNDILYKWGIVVEYNTNPVVRGKGSAIFLHVWQKPGGITVGCASFSEESVLAIFKWLDPSKKPVVVMGIFEDLAKFSK